MNIVDKIYNIINKACDAEYISEFTLTIDEDEWTLKLDLNQSDAPLSLSYQGTESGFYNFLEKELRSRQLARTRYYTGEMTSPGNETEYLIFEYGGRKGN